ncbi:OmpA family protein [Sandaracinobacter sp. RS1-74]|uniref:flagellar motor protein MotB n=1 Tax=Sandaracinobacteroides sayramensis TaxID=2913411 RepID=UPI001EDA4CF2|nr:flagellar motor protein MotB [Sandaracinobacteroides sayramensis]MCG2840087.1 OmpA family protein [Sandaracinobacteroides sayramensis]
MTALGPLPEPEVLIKKVKAKAHSQHHGGAWKVAYADFVTAMMAFFLLMWLLGATDERKRKGIADYFAPTALQSEQSGGSNGMLTGRSIEEPDGVAPHAKRSGLVPVAPYQAPNGARAPALSDDGQLRKVESEIRKRLERDPGLRELQGQIRFTHTPEGLRIELIDKADYSMFASGTAAMDPRAISLLRVVAEVVAPLPQKLAIRGHTDGRPYSGPGSRMDANNWTLSSDRAEMTRRQLFAGGIPERRFARLEGVAATEPFNPEDPFDPRNRRMSVTLLRG